MANFKNLILLVLINIVLLVGADIEVTVDPDHLAVIEIDIHIQDPDLILPGERVMTGEGLIPGVQCHKDADM